MNHTLVYYTLLHFFVHIFLCFRCFTLYSTSAITLCFTGFCKRLYLLLQTKWSIFFQSYKNDSTDIYVANSGKIMFQTWGYHRGIKVELGKNSMPLYEILLHHTNVHQTTIRPKDYFHLFQDPAIQLFFTFSYLCLR